MILIWYAVAVIATLFFAPKLEQAYIKNGLAQDKYGWPSGLVFSIGIACFSIGLYVFGDSINKILVSEYLLSFCSLISMHFLFVYGLRPIASKSKELILIHALSLILALNFLLYNIKINNLILCILSITLTVRLSFQINLPAFLIIMIAMCLFDGYAVWATDIMQKMMSSYPNITPSGLLNLSFSNMRFLGAGDVVFSTLAVAFIRRKYTSRHGFLVAISLICSILILDITTWRPFNPNSFPCMVLITPISLIIILLAKKRISTP